MSTAAMVVAAGIHGDERLVALESEISSSSDGRGRAKAPSRFQRTISLSTNSPLRYSWTEVVPSRPL